MTIKDIAGFAGMVGLILVLAAGLKYAGPVLLGHPSTKEGLKDSVKYLIPGAVLIVGAIIIYYIT